MSEGLRFPDPAPHVLVVDDERMIRWSLRAGLEEAGAAVEEAASLAEARRRLAESWPDLMLLDLRLPDGSGFDLLAEVLEQEGYIVGHRYDDSTGKPRLHIDLKYYEGKPVIAEIERISKPSLRRYSGKDDLPSVRGGLGVAIVSTSRGVMTDRAARAAGVGGEVLCTVF